MRFYITSYSSILRINLTSLHLFSPNNENDNYLFIRICITVSFLFNEWNRCCFWHFVVSIYVIIQGWFDMFGKFLWDCITIHIMSKWWRFSGESESAPKKSVAKVMFFWDSQLFREGKNNNRSHLCKKKILKRPRLRCIRCFFSAEIAFELVRF